jgi:hypothetical protein
MEDDVYSELVAMLTLDKDSFLRAQERFPSYVLWCLFIPTKRFLVRSFPSLVSLPSVSLDTISAIYAQKCQEARHAWDRRVIRNLVRDAGRTG